MTASPLIVLERTVELHQILDAAGVPHAVGGAAAVSRLLPPGARLPGLVGGGP